MCETGFCVESCDHRVSGFRFRVAGLGSLGLGFGFRVSGLGSLVLDFGSRVPGFGFGVSDFGFWVWGFGFRVSGFRLRPGRVGVRCCRGAPPSPSPSAIFHND